MWKRKICGEFPVFGAIFMSNRTTFGDRLNSKLFGLPSSQSHFVKQVRVGMILFLFEKRELHGVFQATSDVMPKPYEPSGKLFPAQVQCTRIWQCDPLRESEFRDAIEENYYETN
ncbi:Development/cell death domain containing protein [Parasponia andersonii]|uniref:Development/cell death domain containing protein n=1 Tax=Parasponia andersonii TaxID=3476 RepID=A0A2P5APN2_PARAD|nr:Development/cell death domain containing protein [Parasponia andersonii]